MMKTTTFTSPYDGHITHLSIFEAHNATATLLIVHGMAEHRVRYDAFAKYLSQNNINVYTMDLRGHNESLEDNTLGYSKGYPLQIDDIEGIIQTIKSKHNTPFILMGHSMGSLLVRSYLKKYKDAQLDGLIVMGSPYKPIGLKALQVGLTLPAKLTPKKQSPFIAGIMNKMYNADIKDKLTDMDWLSFDTNNVKNYMEDPLCGFPFTYGGYLDLFHLIDNTYDSKWSHHASYLPIYFVAGIYDPCVDFKHDGFNKAMDHLKRNGYENITSTLYENSRHEILNDRDQDRVYQNLMTFIKEASCD